MDSLGLMLPRLPPKVAGSSKPLSIFEFRLGGSGESAGLHYKLAGNTKLIKDILESNGFTQHKRQWSLLWQTSVARSNIFAGLEPWQRVNQFPRIYEITKKHNLFKNLAKMQAVHGLQQFGFIPETYVVPADLHKLNEVMQGDLWIVKPAGQCQGKGIFLATSVAELPRRSPHVVCRYINNPMLIDGLKFDLRVYVAITSLHPLKLYIYKEGLARFATETYSESADSRFVHLTNYAVNKDSGKYDAAGHKWTLTALREYFEAHSMSFDLVWREIQAIVIKTIIAVESKLVAAFNMYVSHRKNCFQLLGFDILLDEMQRPWLLEVNMSPSLNTDSKLDLEVKSKLITDLLTLVGIPKPTRQLQSSRRAVRPEWTLSQSQAESAQLTTAEQALLREANAEALRAGDFQRIFPGDFSFTFRTLFEEERPLNYLLAGEFERMRRVQNKSPLHRAGGVYHYLNHSSQSKVPRRAQTGSFMKRRL